MNYLAGRLQEKVSEEMNVLDHINRGLGYVLSPGAVAAGLNTPPATRLALGSDGTMVELPHVEDTGQAGARRGYIPGLAYGALLGGGLGLATLGAPLLTAAVGSILGGAAGRVVGEVAARQKLRSGDGLVLKGDERTTMGAQMRRELGRPLRYAERRALAEREREVLG
jgi:hypothetical protein